MKLIPGKLYKLAMKEDETYPAWPIDFDMSCPEPPPFYLSTNVILMFLREEPEVDDLGFYQFNFLGPDGRVIKLFNLFRKDFINKVLKEVT